MDPAQSTSHGALSHLHHYAAWQQWGFLSVGSCDTCRFTWCIVACFVKEWDLHTHIESRTKVTTNAYRNKKHKHPAVSLSCKASRLATYYMWNIILVMVGTTPTTALLRRGMYVHSPAASLRHGMYVHSPAASLRHGMYVDPPAAWPFDCITVFVATVSS